MNAKIKAINGGAFVRSLPSPNFYSIFFLSADSLWENFSFDEEIDDTLRGFDVQL